MFRSKDDLEYFLVGHSQLVQAVSVVVAMVLLLVLHYSSPSPSVLDITEQQKQQQPLLQQALQDNQPLTLPQVRHLLLQTLPQLYNSSQMTVPPLLRHISFWNHSMCHVNFFQEEHEECVHRDSLQVFRSDLKDVPDPFKDWDESLCGPVPFDPTKYHYNTGQGRFPSQECMSCAHEAGGHLLQLPLPTQHNPNSIFTNTCVVVPLQLWLHDHVGHDTHFILSDTILVSGEEVRRQQLGFQHLALDLWWVDPLSTRLGNQPGLWLLSAFSCGVLGIFQIVAFLFERRGGGQLSSWLFRKMRVVLQLGLVVLCFWMCVMYSRNGTRWSWLVKVLVSETDDGEKDDKAKHEDVWTRYQAHTSYLEDIQSQDNYLLLLTVLLAVNFLSCSRGYLYGFCRGLLRLVYPLLLACVWLLLLAVAGCSTVGHFHPGFKDLLTAASTLLLAWKTGLPDFHATSGSSPFLVGLFLTVYLVMPVLLGFVLAELEAAWRERRGSGRWWGDQDHLPDTTDNHPPRTGEIV